MTVTGRVMLASGDVRVEYGAHKNTVNSFRLVCRDYAPESEGNTWLGMYCVRETYAFGGLNLPPCPASKTREKEKFPYWRTIPPSYVLFVMILS
jgi:hypothetical protein